MSEHPLGLRVLGDIEISQIEQTAFRLLDEVGIAVSHAGAIELLRGAGCKVGRDRVLIPPDVVCTSLKRINRSAVFHSADGAADLVLGDGTVRVHNLGGPAFVQDVDTGTKRPATLQDAIDLSRLLDALPEVDLVIPLVEPQDLPAPVARLESWAATLRYCRKPLGGFSAENPQEVRYAASMARICRRTRSGQPSPALWVAVSPISPLRFPEKVAAAILAVAEAEAGFVPLPCPTLGATSPYSLPAGLALQHAEVLAALVLFAAAGPGLPAIYASRICALDMRTAVANWGNPVVGQAGAGATQLAHRLGLACDCYGFATNSDRVDAQMAYEKLANAMLPALNGADTLSGVAFIANGVAASYEAAVVDNELARLVKHLARPVHVDSQALAFDLVREVALAEGSFVSEAHTVAEIRRGSIWLPGLGKGARGKEDAALSFPERARARAQELLRTHFVPPLPEDTDRDLSAVLADARRNLV